MKIRFSTILSLLSLWIATPCIAQVFDADTASIYEQRLQLLEEFAKEDSSLVSNQVGVAAKLVPQHIEQLKLPPLSVFLEAVKENATVKRAQSQVDQIKNEYRLQKRDWLDFFRVNANYQYGRYNVIGNASDEYTPVYQTAMSNYQHNFYIGAGVGFSLGQLINRPLKLKNYRHQIDQLQYTQEEVMEERKLLILDAYNAVTEQLATINAKAETAALYNAQMKISENNFIQGKMDITSLSLERARRSGAVVTYEQARVQLHNAIILLEMLTNIKIIQ